jgi:hypothetical protein
MRDDFREDVKLLLARRVGFRCSNPNCRQPTAGPAEDPALATNIGVAAHITAASPGGPRFDSTLDAKSRREPDNGIWLCQNHAKLIDSDVQRFTVAILQDWKQRSESAARLDLERPLQAQGSSGNDVELLKFYSQCLDRPAFQDAFFRERSTESFDKAIEDTITAINTGCLRARDGKVLARAKGKSFLQTDTWRDRMDVITDLLRSIRQRYELGKRMGQIAVHPVGVGREIHMARDPALAEWIDRTREEILSIFSSICQEAGIKGPPAPRRYS